MLNLQVLGKQFLRRKAIILATCSIACIPLLWGQSTTNLSDRLNKNDNHKPLSLKKVLEQGLRKNPYYNANKLEDKILDIDWKTTHDSFWLPDIRLTLSTESQRIARLKSGNDANENTVSKSPNGLVALDFGEYTLFNWGKDYLNYQNDMFSYQNSKSALTQKQLEFKHELLFAYFKLVHLGTIEQIYSKQHSKAAFIFRLSREKMATRKISKQEYLQARAEYLQTKIEHFNAQKNLVVQNEEMSKLLSDPAGTRYIYDENIDYKELRSSYDQLEELLKRHNTTIINATRDIKIANRKHDLAVREDLPLPKITLNLGAYNHYFGPERSRTRYETTPGNANTEIVASINATWQIFGADGFINSRKKAKTRTEKELSVKHKEIKFNTAITLIKTTFKEITFHQNQMRILEATMENNQKLFDIALENYRNRKSAFINLADSLKKMTDSEIATENNKFHHLEKKILLSKTLGIEDLPGESFENLARKLKN